MPWDLWNRTSTAFFSGSRLLTKNFTAYFPSRWRDLWLEPWIWHLLKPWRIHTPFSQVPPAQPVYSCALPSLYVDGYERRDHALTKSENISIPCAVHSAVGVVCKEQYMMLMALIYSQFIFFSQIGPCPHSHSGLVCTPSMKTGISSDHESPWLWHQIPVWISKDESTTWARKWLTLEQR